MNPGTFEWCTFDGSLPLAPPAPQRVLHIAPARWLIVAPGEAWLAELAAAQRAGRGVLTDVTGRWVPVAPPGVAASTNPADHALNAAAPLGLVLRDRDVAALWAFDCPVLIVRHPDRIEVLVEASYASSFATMVAGL